ncbi:hypothetical protein BDR26DRAFT_930478 [Obelidium mucronatum]|nr:hypothetical protein BDR26DRAFT_930478 [Obelidium mucronatum]
MSNVLTSMQSMNPNLLCLVTASIVISFGICLLWLCSGMKMQNIKGFYNCVHATNTSFTPPVYKETRKNVSSVSPSVAQDPLLNIKVAKKMHESAQASASVMSSASVTAPSVASSTNSDFSILLPRPSF